jgi:hypothetical protein
MKKESFAKKMAEYRRILKNDFDWDYEFILELLRHKLTRTRKCIASSKTSSAVRVQRIGRQIQRVEDLLNRFLENPYHAEVFKNFHKKYGKLKMVTLPHKKGTLGIPITMRYQKETPQNSRAIHREATRLYKKADRMRNGDLKKAFDLMSKNMQGWWD